MQRKYGNNRIPLQIADGQSEGTRDILRGRPHSLRSSCHSLLPRLHQQILQIQQSLLARVHINKRRRDSGLARSTRSAYFVHVILDFLWHRVNDDMLDLVEVETFRGDTGGDHDVFGAGFK